jgi:hypothetical protein
MNGNYSSSPKKERATGHPDRDPLATQDDPAKFLTQDRSAAEAAVVVEVEGLVQVDLDLGAVGLGDRHLIAVARDVGGHRTGRATTHGLDRGRAGLVGRRPGYRLLKFSWAGVPWAGNVARDSWVEALPAAPALCVELVAALAVRVPTSTPPTSSPPTARAALPAQPASRGAGRCRTRATSLVDGSL